MARSTELKAKKNHQPAEAHEPSWQKDSVDRSLRNARARAQARSDRFVSAAIELLGERDESDFTIQDVVDKSNMSQRTFYTFFDGKDSLLLAVYETILRTTAMPMMRERCEGIADPVLRLRTLMEALSEKTAMPARLSRGLSVLHLRLAESRPNDLAYALEPLPSFIVELLEGVADAGLLRDDVPLTTQAALLQELLLAVYETILRTTAMPMMRERCEGIADPVLRLRTLMEALSEKTAMPARLSRGLSVLHLRLTESRPNDLAYALEPLHSFIVELLEGVADAELLRDDVPLATQAALLQELLLATLHTAVLSGGRSTTIDHLWAFCSAAILRVAT